LEDSKKGGELLSYDDGFAGCKTDG